MNGLPHHDGQILCGQCSVRDVEDHGQAILRVGRRIGIRLGAPQRCTRRVGESITIGKLLVTSYHISEFQEHTGVPKSLPQKMPST
jgi:hypothetical protein